jgi:hypothetical protein
MSALADEWKEKRERSQFFISILLLICYCVWNWPVDGGDVAVEKNTSESMKANVNSTYIVYQLIITLMPFFVYIQT